MFDKSPKTGPAAPEVGAMLTTLVLMRGESKKRKARR